VIPFTNEFGLRDYRVPVCRESSAPRAGWPWLVLVLCVLCVLGGLVRVLR